MGTEYERKFLLKDDTWKTSVLSETKIRQGYLVMTDTVEVRARIEEGSGVLTLKSRESGPKRSEYNVPVATEEAEELLAEFARGEINKTRYRLSITPHEWTVDVFHGEHSGLELLEIEGTEEVATVDLPSWVGTEVTSDPKFRNGYLASHPFARDVAGSGG